MSYNEPQEYVSIIGLSYTYPIVGLLEKLKHTRKTRINSDHTKNYENGYSVGIIVLCVLLIESAINRAQYVLKINPVKIPLDFINDYLKEPDLKLNIEELFIVRDIIVHNHVWEAFYHYEIGERIVLSSSLLKEGYGDKKFKRTIDTKHKKTKNLGLNVIPTSFRENDVIIVFQKMVDFLLYLEKLDYNYFQLSNHRVEFEGEIVIFKDLLKQYERQRNQ